MQTLWVYTDRVAGTIQELSPTPSNPTSVKVAGQTYEIETASAAYELSDLGSYQVGDTVTLLAWPLWPPPPPLRTAARSASSLT